MTVEAIYPQWGKCSVAEALDRFLTGSEPVEPFSPGAIEFATRFSQELFKRPEARTYPELQALAFWFRNAAVKQLAGEFAARQPQRTVRTARGVVFHVPPSNVDTIFIYSWMLATLCGNRNIVRLPQRTSPQTDVLLDVLRQTAAKQVLLLRYGHELEITEAISQRCDLRIIWGGDQTINAVRKAALPPHAHEITFADRYSFAVVKAEAYRSLPETAALDLAQRFFNDVFWFDQMACSSPRLLIWAGEPDSCRTASELFFQRTIQFMTARGYRTENATRMNRFAFACRAILDDRALQMMDSPQLTLLGIDSLNEDARAGEGGGVLFQFAAPGLSSVSSFILRRDQTVTHFGFAEEELRAWVRQLGPRGVDRVVPIGQALTFDHIWDGYDLLGELTRTVRLEREQ